VVVEDEVPEFHIFHEDKDRLRILYERTYYETDSFSQYIQQLRNPKRTVRKKMLKSRQKKQSTKMIFGLRFVVFFTAGRFGVSDQERDSLSSSLVGLWPITALRAVQNGCILYDIGVVLGHPFWTVIRVCVLNSSAL
jgi:hypothetical protein